MPRFRTIAEDLAIALWAGALWTAGYLVAPELFRTLPDRMLAGEVAGRLFTKVAWIGIGAAALLLALQFLRHGRGCLRRPGFWILALMAMLACAGEFGIQPFMAELKAEARPLPVMESPLRGRFALWHGISSSLYLLQSIGALALVAGRDRLLR